MSASVVRWRKGDRAGWTAISERGNPSLWFRDDERDELLAMLAALGVAVVADEGLVAA